VTALVFDVSGILILVGVVCAWLRGSNADRTRAPSTPGQDRLALGVIGGIVLVGFILEAMRIVITANPTTAGFAFIGYGLSRLLDGMQGLETVYGYLWYVHAILTAAFIAYLPFSRLMHIIMAPVALIINAVRRQHHS
jgi:nitrate reductase gamma subunit